MYRALTEGKRSYRGRSLKLRVSRAEKSAEVIILKETSCAKENKAQKSHRKRGRTERKLVFNFEWTERNFIAIKNENRKNEK